MSLASGGWLDSRIREGYLFRHAVWYGFDPQPAADAAVPMEWLAAYTSGLTLAQRLRQTATGAIARIPDRAAMNLYNVSHNAYPVATGVHKQGKFLSTLPISYAAGLLVRTYLVGYLLTGYRDYLEQGRYWAWTGVPFVYLVNLTAQPVDPYATIPVYGTTQMGISCVVRAACAVVWASVRRRPVPTGTGRSLRRSLARDCGRRHGWVSG